MYTKNEKAVIWIDMFDFLSTKKQEEILAIFGIGTDGLADGC